jgi:hypothetical protein
MPEKKGLVITTERGVFFGYAEPTNDKIIKLEKARMCVSWPKENHGVVGLAADGPAKGARISPAAPEGIIHGVTALFVASKKAVEEWEKEIWN